MLGVRKVVACGALLSLGWLILSMPAPAFPAQVDLRMVLVPLLLPLLATIAGILAGWPWSRWLGLSAAIAVLPWAVAFVSGQSYGVPQTRPWIVLLAASALIAALTGRVAFAHFEGRAAGADWRGPRMALVRWTVICNVAAVLNLYVFATAYAPAAVWHSLIPGGLALGLVLGVWLLAQQKTLGLLVLAPCCLLLPPASLYFVLQQPVSGAERILFGALFLPGWLTAATTLASFAGPLRRYVRD